MSRYPWKRWAITALGCFILGIGIGFCDLSKLGTDPFTVLLVGMHVQLGGTIGLMNIFVNIFMILFGFLVDKKMISAATFIAMAACSLGIDIVGWIFPNGTSGIGLAILSLLFGELLYAFGTAVAILPDSGFDPYNAFLIGLQKVTKQSYRTVRWSVEAVFTLVGYLLGGIVGAGTILTLLATGPLVEVFLKRLKERFQFSS